VPATAELVTLEPVNAGRAVLGAADVDGRGIEIDLLPANVDQLTDPQCMPEGHKDEQPIADRVAAVAGGGQQAVDLALGQVLALSVIGVLGATTANCRLFRPRGSQLDNRIHWQIPPSTKSTVDIMSIATMPTHERWSRAGQGLCLTAGSLQMSGKRPSDVQVCTDGLIQPRSAPAPDIVPFIETARVLSR
jgi:hypothetical protein